MNPMLDAGAEARHTVGHERFRCLPAIRITDLVARDRRAEE